MLFNVFSFLLFFIVFAYAQEESKNQKSEEIGCIKLNQIFVDEDEIFDKTEQEELLAQYIGGCIDTLLLQDVLGIVSQFYIDKGYITTKPYYKEQNILDGKVEISVLKGYVEDIIHSETNSSDGRIATAFLFQKDEVLDLRDLETSLEMMNRVPSYRSIFSIKPGTQPGESIVEIQTQKEMPYRLMIGGVGEKDGYDNNPYLNVDLSIDNLLNINDILTFRYNGSRVQSYYQSSFGTEIDYSFPISSYVVSYTWFRYKYSQAVLGLNDTYRSSGDTTGSNLKVSKILHRTQNNKLEAAFSVQYKDNKNYFSNQLIDVSSYKTALAQVDLIDTYYRSWGELRNILSYYRGTDWLGARDDGSILGSDEKLQFTKFSLDTNFIYNLPLPTYSINLNAHVQYTSDLLYDNNKLRVGSYYTVRGYEASYYGNNAYYVRSDLIKTFYLNLHQNYLQSISPFLGFDYGGVRCESNTQNACGSLSGAAIGFKTSSKSLDTEFTLSRGLKHSMSEELQSLFRYSLIFKY